MFRIKYCSLDGDKELSGHFNKLTGSLNVHNVFNPSFYCDENIKIFAFRATPHGNDGINSYVSIEDKKGRLVKNISVDLYKEVNGVRLIDPKVAKINGEFYITFNSGHIPGGNDVFIMKIYPQMESPKRIVYGNRQKQERNWAFFSEQGEIYALYWINPLRILKVKNISDKTWEMEDFYCGKEDTNILNGLTLGTQLFSSDNKYHFIAHKKVRFLGKKLYLGKFCEMDFKNKQIKTSRHWMVHSFKSLFGSRIKHNTKLFSCTYFSGIQIKDGLVKLGYGINDVEFGFSRHKLGECLESEREKTFNKVYEDCRWGGEKGEFFSGGGSNDINTAEYGEYVRDFILKRNISGVVDIGCGDFRIGRLIDWKNAKYTGIDIVKELIDKNNKIFGKENIRFIHKDAVEEELPDGELCLIRQVLQHLSNEDISKILPKLKKYKYVLLTDGLPISDPKVKNLDKPTDHNNRWDPLYKSGLYLECPPFNLEAKVVLDYLSNDKKERFRTLLMEN